MKKLNLILFFLLFSAIGGFAQYTKPAPPFAGFKTALQISALACSTRGTLVWNSTTLAYNVCTATGSPGTWAAIGGGASIGGTVTSATQCSVFFAGAAGVLAQDNAGLCYTDADNQLKITASAATQNPLLIKLAAAHSGNAFEIQPNGSTSPLSFFGAGGNLTFPGVADSTFAVSINRTSGAGDQKGLEIISGTGSNLAANQGIYMHDGAGHTMTTSYTSANGFYQAIDSAGYTLTTGGGVGSRTIRFQPGSVDRQIMSPKKTLVNNTTTSIYEIALPTLTGTGGVIKCTVFAANATDVQSRSQLIRYSVVNKGGTYTKEIAVVSEAVSASTGTLTGTWTILDGSDKVTLQFNGNSSITPTTLWVQYTIESFSDQTITIL